MYIFLLINCPPLLIYCIFCIMQKYFYCSFKPIIFICIISVPSLNKSQRSIYDTGTCQSCCSNDISQTITWCHENRAGWTMIGCFYHIWFWLASKGLLLVFWTTGSKENITTIIGGLLACSYQSWYGTCLNKVGSTCLTIW